LSLFSVAGNFVVDESQMTPLTKVLLIAAGGLFGILVLVYGIRFFFGGEKEYTANDLAEIAITSSDKDERQRAAARISEAGDGAVEALKRVLNEADDESVRGIAMYGLAETYDYDSMPLVLEGLEDPSFDVRWNAGRACQRMLNLKNFEYNAAEPPESQKRQIERITTEWNELKKSGLLDEWKRRLQEKQNMP
jgi:hypothetical protein